MTLRMQCCLRLLLLTCIWYVADKDAKLMLVRCTVRKSLYCAYAFQRLRRALTCPGQKDCGVRHEVSVSGSPVPRNFQGEPSETHNNVHAAVVRGQGLGTRSSAECSQLKHYSVRPVVGSTVQSLTATYA